MTVKLLTEHYLEFLSLKGGCTGSSESTLIKMPHCWKSHVMAQMYVFCFSMITDVQLAIFANALGVTLFLLVVLYHYVSVNNLKKE